ncbi:MAG: nucleotidyltransferase family protein [Clostridium sp.]|nr:nucleotidyltransferase family protein [Clostridium sp.]
MNREEKFLIDICRAYFNNRTVNIPESMDWRAFCKIAKNHNLIGICYCVLTKYNIPNSVLKALQDKFFDLVYIYECQSRALNDINTCLTACSIPYVLFKGSVLRELYPVPESRSMGDIDLLVSKKDETAVKAELKKINFSCYASNGPVQEYSRDNIILEVHTKIISEFNADVFSDAMSHAVFDGACGRLEDNYHFAYLIAHIAHHFKFYGAGMKLILDLAIMLSKRDIDIAKVLDILESAGLRRFGYEILSVCFHWFEIGEAFIEDTSKTEEYLLKCGAFGSLQSNKGAVVARKDLEEGKNINSSLITKLRLAFPSYDRLKNIPYIKFIEGRPWLTPYAWLYRFIYNFKYKKDFVKHTLNTINEKETKALAQAELNYFEEIGLL